MIFFFLPLDRLKMTQNIPHSNNGERKRERETCRMMVCDGYYIDGASGSDYSGSKSSSSTVSAEITTVRCDVKHRKIACRILYRMKYAHSIDT